MSTPRDLLYVTLDVPGDRPVEQGDLSLALAGAELVDLLAGGAAFLDGDRIRPGLRTVTDDRLLDAAGAALVGEAPYESVEDWLWRRGDGLAASYGAALDAEEHPGGSRHRWRPGRPAAGAAGGAPSAARQAAAGRWTAREPVLVALAAALGIEPEAAGAEPPAEPDDDAVVTVVAAVADAVTELEAVRQRRRVEDAAFDNIWRSP
ncbi:GPP34 family phosphoprotein [Streptomyces sp. NPDC021356]|uniref:GPP34 family phosphoprotein n=1 Tax=Streptomyces sp. NPDC021356 TaxID=3154900 RepID=UPI003400EACC